MDSTDKLDSAEKLTPPIDPSASRRHVIVGIGASAGGLRPLEEFFSLVPTDTGCSFVVVQHLSPDFESVMDTLLSRRTEMPIRVIETGMSLDPDTIYLNPPRMNVEVAGGEFVLSLFKAESLRLPINVLFQSIANQYASDSVAIVMSGTGSDGTHGLAAVHRGSGLTIVQSVESAEFDGMPKNAIATGLADFVVSPTAMAQLICEHARTPIETVANGSDTTDDETLAGMNDVQVIFSLLVKEHGIDFSHYKPGTVARRIDRRLQLSRYGGLEKYAAVLRSDPAELSLLYQDLLIGVTSFFRDPDSFRSLRIELATAVEAATAESPLRVWCAGCASGEEAYSLAIMIYEMFAERRLEPNFKVFATDVHDGSLEIAARGIYSTDRLDGLTDHQRELFFASHSDTQSRALPRIRNHLVFAKQNVVSDPPFTKMDLVICRNLLIYLQDDAQAAAISGFRFAIAQNGLLMLGPSETLGRLASGFDPIDKTWRLFRKNDHAMDGIDEGNGFRSRNMMTQRSRTFNLVEAESRSIPMPDVSYRLLADLLPSALLLDGNSDVLEVFGTVSDFLQVASDKVRGNLLDFFDGPTGSTLIAILTEAQTAIGKECGARGVRLGTAANSRSADVFAKAFHVSPGKDPVTLVRFEPSSIDEESVMGSVVHENLVHENLVHENLVHENLVHEDQVHEDQIDQDQVDDDAVANAENPNAVIRAELNRTRISLGSSIQDLEYTNQELQSANEEMIASNEELQATNEELQSVNEELHTVNIEHQRKVQELEQMTDDFNNLFDSTDVGSILLDTDLRIRKFTSATRRYFNLMPHDVGRPLENFASQISLDDMFERVRNVLRSGERFRTKARDKDGKLVSVDISPYRASNEVKGVIIHIFEIIVLGPNEQQIELEG